MNSSQADFWNSRFDTDAYVFGTRPAAFVEENAHLLPPASRILLPADGEGRNSVFLAEHGHHVVATDISPNGLAKARQLATVRRVSVDFQLVDLMGWEWPEAEFDAVVAVFIQFAPPTFRDEIFAGIERSVRRGGLVLLHGYTPKQLDYKTGGPPVVEQLYTEELLRKAFERWELLRLQSYERELDEGEGHKGRSALIDLIARRR